MNHRCPKRVVRLINKIRDETDGIQQRARTDAADGFVRLFTVSDGTHDRLKMELLARGKMAELTADADWNKVDGVKTLILEHNMAAKRLGFVEMFEPLSKVESFQTGVSNLRQSRRLEIA